ncbi:hypothetical protein ACFOHY_11865 [Rhizobium rosettiformans]|uniref:hypothetical protein n=1 Tax=Rhizobium rosettiformans TaxID=1368430 RepID=UPI003609D4DB
MTCTEPPTSIIAPTKKTGREDIGERQYSNCRKGDACAAQHLPSRSQTFEIVPSELQ